MGSGQAPTPQGELRRQRVLKALRQAQGANFRALVRLTHIASGTLLHHLNVLKRRRLILEARHRFTVRFYTADHGLPKNVAAHVLLQDPALQQVADWLAANPGAHQKAVLEAFDAHGWSRSTTQHRLDRLVQAGVLALLRVGRRAIYRRA